MFDLAPRHGSLASQPINRLPLGSARASRTLARFFQVGRASKWKKRAPLLTSAKPRKPCNPTRESDGTGQNQRVFSEKIVSPNSENMRNMERMEKTRRRLTAPERRTGSRTYAVEAPPRLP
jgi:hypothetical protein